ncbi:TPA: hypothetical protein ACH3X1_004239 [Trebouxia sp. C0004]
MVVPVTDSAPERFAADRADVPCTDSAPVTEADDAVVTAPENVPVVADSACAVTFCRPAAPETVNPGTARGPAQVIGPDREMELATTLMLPSGDSRHSLVSL